MTLLVVDDNRSVLAAVRLLAEIKFDRVLTTTSPSRIPQLLREEKPSCVLLDMNFSSPVTNGNEGLYWLSEIRRSPHHPCGPVHRLCRNRAGRPRTERRRCRLCDQTVEQCPSPPDTPSCRNTDWQSTSQPTRRQPGQSARNDARTDGTTDDL